MAPGKLVLPFIEKKGRTLVFFLCRWLTDEDEVPDWVEDFFPMDLKILSHPSVFMTSPGIGTITCNKKNLDWANIPREQEIEDGSLLKVRSEFHEVLGWSVDAFKPNLKSVRFTRNFSKNANNALYYICERPVMKGIMQWILNDCLSEYRPFTMKLDKIDKDQHGRLTLMCQNACFNKLGFLTHDTAV